MIPGLLAMLGASAGSNMMNTGLGMLSNFTSGIWNRNNAAYLQENQKNQNLSFIEQSPQAYVSGLQQAGLNPMLAYGSPSQPMVSSTASAGSSSGPSSGGNTGKQLKALIHFLKEVKKL